VPPPELAADSEYSTASSDSDVPGPVGAGTPAAADVAAAIGDSSSAPESSKQGAKKSFRGAHGERRTRDAKGVEFEVPRVETPKASRGWEMGTGYPLPS